MVTNPSYPSPESLPQGKGDPKSHPGAMTDRIPMSFSPGMPTRAEGTPKSYQRALPIHSWITASISPWPRGGQHADCPPGKPPPSWPPRAPHLGHHARGEAPRMKSHRSGLGAASGASGLGSSGAGFRKPGGAAPVVPGPPLKI